MTNVTLLRGKLSPEIRNVQLPCRSPFRYFAAAVITHCRLRIAVAGELLDDENVGTIRKQVRDAAPSEIVRRKRFHAGFATVSAECARDPLAAQSTRATADLIHAKTEGQREIRGASASLQLPRLLHLAHIRAGLCGPCH